MPKQHSDAILVTFELDKESGKTLKRLAKAVACLNSIIRIQPWNEEAKLARRSIRLVLRKSKLIAVDPEERNQDGTLRRT